MFQPCSLSLPIFSFTLYAPALGIACFDPCFLVPFRFLVPLLPTWLCHPLRPMRHPCHLSMQLSYLQPTQPGANQFLTYYEEEDGFFDFGSITAIISSFENGSFVKHVHCGFPRPMPSRSVFDVLHTLLPTIRLPKDIQPSSFVSV